MRETLCRTGAGSGVSVEDRIDLRATLLQGPRSVLCEVFSSSIGQWLLPFNPQESASSTSREKPGSTKIKPLTEEKGNSGRHRGVPACGSVVPLSPCEEDVEGHGQTHPQEGGVHTLLSRQGQVGPTVCMHTEDEDRDLGPAECTASQAEASLRGVSVCVRPSSAVHCTIAHMGSLPPGALLWPPAAQARKLTAAGPLGQQDSCPHCLQQNPCRSFTPP